MLKRALALVIAFALAIPPAPALAQTTIPASIYTDLGAGPAQIVNLTPGTQVSICAAASQPAPDKVCQSIAGGAPPVPFPVAANVHLWAMPIGRGAGSVLSSAIATSSGGSGGSIPTGAAGSPNAAVASVQGVVGGTAVPTQDNNAAATQAATRCVAPCSSKLQSVVYPDLSSTVITATNNSGPPIVMDAGTTLAATISVSSVTGTNPHLRLSLWATSDGGVTSKKIWDCPDIAATATCQIPEMQFSGQRQWNWQVSGASPSFTISINVSRGHGYAPVLRNFLDYSINPNTASSTTATWDVAGCKTGYIFQSNTAAPTSAQMQGWMSADGINFSSFGNVLTTTANSTTAASFSTPPMQYVRVVTDPSHVGSGVTLNYVGLSCAG